MTEVRRTLERGPIRWGFDPAFAALAGLWEALHHPVISGASPWVQMMVPAAAGLVVAVFAFGLLLTSRMILDGPEVWAFDSEGYRHARDAWLWPTGRRITYTDIARIQVKRSPVQPATHILTLILRSGKSVRIRTTWDQAELVAIRDLLAEGLPGSDLPV